MSMQIITRRFDLRSTSTTTTTNNNATTKSRVNTIAVGTRMVVV